MHRFKSRFIGVALFLSSGPDVIAIVDPGLGNRSVTNYITNVLRRIEYYHQGFPNQSISLPMANEEHLQMIRQGVDAWNKWRDEHPKIQPDLSGANLIEAHLRGAKLGGTNLRGAIIFHPKSRTVFGLALAPVIQARRGYVSVPQPLLNLGNIGIVR
jgi:Pentapeptide repeats (8 copies)